MTKEKNKIFSELTLGGIKKYLDLNKKIGIIVNKKGYSSGIICEDCGNIPKCKNCDVPVAYHMDASGSSFGICHICKTQYNSFEHCPKCGSYGLSQYGYGIQKIQQILQESFGITASLVESETVNSPNKIKRIQENLKNSKIILGTSLLINPIKDISFDLVIFLNADIGLNIPDFNANYQNFLFLYDTFNKHSTTNFVVQTFNPDSYSINSACNMNREEFRKKEMEYRKSFVYPPFTDMCVIMYKNEIEQSLFTKVNKLYQELLFLKEKSDIKDLEIFSTPPLIYKMFGKYRYNIILKSKDLRKFMDEAYIKLKIFEKGFKIDWEPNNLV